MKTIPLLLLIFTATLPLATAAIAAESVHSAGDPWEAIKDFTFEQRGEFLAGAGRLLEKIDGQIRQLKERRPKVPETSATDWDFAMKGLVEARSYLKSSIARLSETTAETWSEAKERIGRAWQQAEGAYGKVKASTTS